MANWRGRTGEIVRYYRLDADRAFPAGTTRVASSERLKLKDVELPAGWYLGRVFDSAGAQTAPRSFTRGQVVAALFALRVEQEISGLSVGFTFAARGVPIVTRGVGEIIAELAGSEVQLLPVTVDGDAGQYFILNVLKVIWCLDESRSWIERWTAADGRPEKIGQYRTIAYHQMFIDPARTEGAQVFRLGGWELEVIVSERVRAALESHGVTGVTFHRVTV